MQYAPPRPLGDMTPRRQFAVFGGPLDKMVLSFITPGLLLPPSSGLTNDPGFLWCLLCKEKGVQRKARGN